ncbi:hypothetical protein [Fluviicola sp.]|uniref:hypothetical protein n=1 Tax=Fluviicola sp. TaxID=1917219 RepID=UPI0026264C8A|nr:hypothetical protein [Fluviicola sp.]
MKTILPLCLVVLTASCTSTIKKNNFEHNYPKYWEKYTDLQLRDSIFADTLLVGSDTDTESSAKDFYKEEIHRLLIDLKNDKYKNDRLYPMLAFNEVVLSNLASGETYSLSDYQIEKLLTIINDPLSFNWSETTLELAFRIDFVKDGLIVSTLNIEDDKSVIKINPELSGFRKMKFGMLKPRFQKQIMDLFNEIGL